MHLLIMKNTENKVVLIEKFSPTEYPFPALSLAEDRGKQLLTLEKEGEPIYKSFHTMELNYFIESMTKRFGLEV